MLLALLLGGLAMPLLGQPMRARLALELGTGTSNMTWSEASGLSLEHNTYRPALYGRLGFYLPLLPRVILMPYGGLHYEQVSYQQVALRSFGMRYHFLTVPAGVFLLLKGHGPVFVGFGAEARYLRKAEGRLRSVSASGLREWVTFDETEAFESWSYYFAPRLGVMQEGLVFSIEYWFNNEGRTPVGRLFERNRIAYQGVRLMLGVLL